MIGDKYHKDDGDVDEYPSTSACFKGFHSGSHDPRAETLLPHCLSLKWKQLGSMHYVLGVIFV